MSRSTLSARQSTQPGPRAARRAREAALAILARRLGDDELELVTLVAARARVGQRRYGRLVLAHDRRDFAVEMIEEAVDAIWYGAAVLIRLLRRRRTLSAVRRGTP